MKILIVLILSVILSAELQAQTIDMLDKKNGFKDFSLGDTFTKWQNQLEFESNLDNGSKEYLYTGSCCNKVFNYPVKQILLRFNDERLVAIYITTENFQKPFSESGEYTTWRSDDFESIKSSFSVLFGEPTTMDHEKGSGNVSYIWKGKKVILFSIYENLSVTKGDRQLIVIADMSASKKAIEDGF